jgi:hypothetical protein
VSSHAAIHVEITMSQSEKQGDPREARDASEEVQDLPAKPVDGAETDQVKGGADPINTKPGAKTMLPADPINN